MSFFRFVGVTGQKVYGVRCVLWPTVRNMTQSQGGRRIPADTFRIRLAIVRAEQGWNYDQAQAATGISSESWRLWEKGARHCSDVIGVSARIAEVTPYDRTWLALGGPLSMEDDTPSAPARRGRRAGVSRTRVTSGSTRDCMSSTRRRGTRQATNCLPVAA